MGITTPIQDMVEDLWLLERGADPLFLIDKNTNKNKVDETESDLPSKILKESFTFYVNDYYSFS